MRAFSNIAQRGISGLAQALRWWFAELREIFAPMSRRLGLERPVAIVDLGQRKVTVSLRPSQSDGADERRIDANFLDLTAAQVAQLLSWTSHSDVVIWVPPQETCSIRMELLGAVRASTEAVRIRLLQESPLPIDQIVFAWNRIPGAASSPKSREVVEVLLCRKAYLERLLDATCSFGIPLKAIGPRPASAGGVGPSLSSGSSFPFDAARFGMTTWRLRVTRWLTAGLVLTPLCGVVVIGGLAKWQGERARAELLALAPPLKEGALLVQRHAALANTHGELRRFAAQPTATAVMNELARRAPNDTWLTGLRVDASTVRVQGMSADPTGATKALSSSALLHDLRLSSATAPAGGVAAQFEIVGRIKERHE